MQQALRPYVTTGIAVVGASALIAAPVASPPTLPDLNAYKVQLTASLDFGQLADLGTLSDPLSVYGALLTNSFNNVSDIVAGRLSDPLPILEAIATNQFGYFTQVIGNPASIVDVPGQMLGNAANIFATLTDLSPDVTLNVPLVDGLEHFVDLLGSMTIGDFISELLGAIFTGKSPLVEALEGLLGALTTTPLATLNVLLPAPIVMGLAGLGPLVNGGDAFATTMGAFQTALGGSSPDYLAALATMVSAPGFITDAILNGQWGLEADADVLGNVGIPLFNGLLQPMDEATISLLGDLLRIEVGPLGGMVDGFVNYLPQTIADALLKNGATTAVPGLGDIFSGLPFALGDLFDLNALLGGIGLSSLGELVPAAAGDLSLDALAGLLDPTWILGLLTSF